MSDQIQSELRAYMSYLDTQVAPMTIDEMTERRFGSESVRPIGLQAQSADLQPRPRWLIVVTSAAAVLLLLGGAAWLTRMTGSDTPVADTVVPTTLAATDVAPQDEATAVSVTGHLLDSHYWQGPIAGPGAVLDARMEMSDERLSGDVTFTSKADGWEPLDPGDPGQGLYWGTMVIENDGGTWEGTHFAALHHSDHGPHGPGLHPIVMQFVGSGDYEGLAAILIRTFRTETSVSSRNDETSVDGMIFPGDLPPNRN